MLPIRFIEEYLISIPPDLRDIVLELRNIIKQVAWDATEVVRWKGLMYHHAGKGGIVSAGICGIHVENDHVVLSFIHGAFLPDPEALLRGERKAKRFARIYSYDDAPWDALKALIEASSRFDPRSLVESK